MIRLTELLRSNRTIGYRIVDLPEKRMWIESSCEARQCLRKLISHAHALY